MYSTYTYIYDTMYIYVRTQMVGVVWGRVYSRFPDLDSKPFIRDAQIISGLKLVGALPRPRDKLHFRDGKYRHEIKETRVVVYVVDIYKYRLLVRHRTSSGYKKVHSRCLVNTGMVCRKDKKVNFDTNGTP